MLSCAVAVGMNIIPRAVLISDDTDNSSVSSAVKVMWPRGLSESMLAIPCNRGRSCLASKSILCWTCNTIADFCVSAPKKLEMLEDCKVVK